MTAFLACYRTSLQCAGRLDDDFFGAKIAFLDGVLSLCPFTEADWWTFN